MDPFKTESSTNTFKCPPLTDEEFNLFYSIDRELFTILFHTFGFNPHLAMQLVALFMWLEKRCGNMNLVRRMVTLSFSKLREIVNDAVICLKCAENNNYVLNEEALVRIRVLPSFMSNPMIGLGFFRENSDAVLKGVSEITKNICERACRDIWQRRVPAGREGEVEESSGMGESNVVARMPHLPIRRMMLVDPNLTGPVVRILPGGGSLLWMPAQPTPQVLEPQPLINHNVPVEEQRIGLPKSPLGVEGQHRVEEEIASAEEEIVPPDERTIFLTFSRGYPVTTYEIHDFFTRKFGDFIEKLIMQEVRPDEQVIYARMIAKSASVIPEITEGGSVKYTIHGKHILARKYVKTRQNTSVGESSSSQLANAPAE